MIDDVPAAEILASYASHALTGNLGLTKSLRPVAARMVKELAKQGYHLVCIDGKDEAQP